MRRTGLALICLVLAACGSTKPPPSPTGFAFDRRNYISFEEIKATKNPGSSAWDLISRTRPNFLRTRGASSLRDTSPVGAMIYVNGVLYGRLESLKSLDADDIREIEFISAGDATTRFGTDHLGGAILIHTR